MRNTEDPRLIRDAGALVGRTIAQFKLMMRFTDGTYTALLADADSGVEDANLDFFQPSYLDLYRAGVLSKEDYDDIDKQKKAESRELRRQEFERLRKEFESDKLRPQQFERLRKEFESEAPESTQDP